MYHSSHESVVSVYRDMIDYYLVNIGKLSKYSLFKTIITPMLIVNTVKRYNEIVPDYSKIILNGELENDGEKELKN